MNVENLNKLIAHLEDQEPARINMRYPVVKDHGWGTCGCIIGHADLVWPELTEYEIDDNDGLASKLRMGFSEIYRLTHPVGWKNEHEGNQRYPAYRVISTLKRLRDTYLTTGKVVVDWGPEPGEEPKTVWVAPQVAEVITALPAEITSLLRPSLAKTEA